MILRGPQLGRSSRWGAFLDSTLDRVADSAIFGGLALWYAGSGDDNILCAVSIFCLASGQVVSYTKARAEANGLKGDGGMIERPERLLIVLIGTGLSGVWFLHVPWLVHVAMWVLAVASLVTLGQRLHSVRRSPGAADPLRTDSAAGTAEETSGQ